MASSLAIAWKSPSPLPEAILDPDSELDKNFSTIEASAETNAPAAESKESRSGEDRDETDELDKDNINTDSVAKADTNLDLPTREEVTTSEASAELKVADNLV